MIKSMTAYGRGEYQHGDVMLISEMKSLNNRYRDIILKIPKKYQALEKDLKSIISSKIARGRIEVSVQIENGIEEGPFDLELNIPIVNSYIKIFEQLAEQFGLDQDVTVQSLCQMSDVILAKPAEVDLEKLKPGFEAVVNKALDSLDEMRIKEGETIESDFKKRLDLLEKYAKDIVERVPDLLEAYAKRLKENITRLSGDLDVDEGRIAQEVALLAEKSDVTEEIVRIRSHIDQYRQYVMGEGSVGRRLDFLIQEIGREVNTLGAKASDSVISITVVEMKAELEKLREQVQNVE